MNLMKQRKKRGNPGTPEAIKGQIYTLKASHPNALAPQIHSMLKDRLKEGSVLGYTVTDLPTERTVRSILAKFGPVVETDEDNPWSLACLDLRIPPEATHLLLKMWRWCLVIGRPFTIREAKWAARLRGIIPYDAEVELRLLPWAFTYSIRERVAGTLKQPLDTRDLDSHIAFLINGSAWLYISAVECGLISLEDDPETTLGRWSFVTCPGREVERKIALRSRQPPLRIVHDEYLFEEADIVYALRLRKLSEEPGWAELDWETMEKVARYLHKVVANEEIAVKEKGVVSVTRTRTVESLAGILEEVARQGASSTQPQPAAQKKNSKAKEGSK